VDNPENNPVVVAAISSVATAFFVWLSGRGWPLIKEALGLMGEKEKLIREQAKEGPIMVLEEVKRQLADTKSQAAQDKAEQLKQFNEVLIELKDLRKQHHDCEMKHAELQSEVKWLRTQMAELKGEE